MPNIIQAYITSLPPKAPLNLRTRTNQIPAQQLQPFVPPQFTRNTICLLKTAIATVVNANSQVEANILFNEGSQRSFITEELASTLGAVPQRSRTSTYPPLVHHNRSIKECTMLHFLKRRPGTYFSTGGTNDCSSTCKHHKHRRLKLITPQGAITSPPCIQ